MAVDGMQLPHLSMQLPHLSMQLPHLSMQLPHLSRQFCARLQQSYSKCEVVQYTAVVRISLCLIDTQS